MEEENLRASWWARTKVERAGAVRAEPQVTVLLGSEPVTAATYSWKLGGLTCPHSMYVLGAIMNGFPTLTVGGVGGLVAGTGGVGHGTPGGGGVERPPELAGPTPCSPPPRRATHVGRLS